MSTHAEPQDVDELKKELTKNKKNFTRYINASGRQTAFATQHKSDVAEQEVKRSMERVQIAYGNLISTLDNLQSATDTDAELAALERTKEDTQERYEEALERIMTTIEELKTPTTLAQAQQANQQGVHKPHLPKTDKTRPKSSTA